VVRAKLLIMSTLFSQCRLSLVQDEEVESVLRRRNTSCKV
jgi:hypothetical protein